MMFKKILNYRIGEIVPVWKRTKFIEEFTGLTIRNWLMVPPRVVLMAPLMILEWILLGVGKMCSKALIYIGEKLV